MSYYNHHQNTNNQNYGLNGAVLDQEIAKQYEKGRMNVSASAVRWFNFFNSNPQAFKQHLIDVASAVKIDCLNNKLSPSPGIGDLDYFGSIIAVLGSSLLISKDTQECQMAIYNNTSGARDIIGTYMDVCQKYRLQPPNPTTTPVTSTSHAIGGYTGGGLNTSALGSQQSSPPPSNFTVVQGSSQVVQVANGLKSANQEPQVLLLGQQNDLEDLDTWFSLTFDYRFYKESGRVKLPNGNVSIEIKDIIVFDMQDHCLSKKYIPDSTVPVFTRSFSTGNSDAMKAHFVENPDPELKEFSIVKVTPVKSRLPYTIDYGMYETACFCKVGDLSAGNELSIATVVSIDGFPQSLFVEELAPIKSWLDSIRRLKSFEEIHTALVQIKNHARKSATIANLISRLDRYFADLYNRTLRLNVSVANASVESFIGDFDDLNSYLVKTYKHRAAEMMNSIFRNGDVFKVREIEMTADNEKGQPEDSGFTQSLSPEKPKSEPMKEYDVYSEYVVATIAVSSTDLAIVTAGKDEGNVGLLVTRNKHPMLQSIIETIMADEEHVGIPYIILQCIDGVSYLLGRSPMSMSSWMISRYK